MSASLNIEGIDRARLIQELYNNTKALGMGVLHDLKTGMTLDTAKALIMQAEEYNKDKIHFDYVYGRPIKVSFTPTELERPDLYDRDAPGGLGTCERIVNQLRKEASPA